MTPEEIKKIREEMGLSQERFAALIGATSTTVNRWELGKAKPSRMAIIAIKSMMRKK